MYYKVPGAGAVTESCCRAPCIRSTAAPAAPLHTIGLPPQLSTNTPYTLQAFGWWRPLAMSTSLPIPLVPPAHTVATGVGHVAGVMVQWLSISTATCCTVGTHGLCLAYRHCRPRGSRSADPPNTVVVSCTRPCVRESRRWPSGCHADMWHT